MPIAMANPAWIGISRRVDGSNRSSVMNSAAATMIGSISAPTSTASSIVAQQQPTQMTP